MKISYHKKFIKSYQKRDQKIRNKFQQKLKLFINSPNSKELNNHSLSGKYSGYRSINITGDYRAIFRLLTNGDYEFVEFTQLGTHSELY